MAMDRKAFDRINYGLFLVGAAGESQPQGCIVNSLHQVTSSMPPKFSLTINKSNETYKAIESPAASPPPSWLRTRPRNWWTVLATSPAG